MFKATAYINEDNCLNLFSTRVGTMRTTVGDANKRVVINTTERNINTINLEEFTLQVGDLLTLSPNQKTVNVHRHNTKEAKVYKLQGVDLTTVFNSTDICNIESVSIDFNNSPYWYLYNKMDLYLLNYRALRVINKDNRNMFFELIKAKNNKVHINLYRYKKFRKAKLNIISCTLIDLADLVSTLGEQATFAEIHSTYFN